MHDCPIDGCARADVPDERVMCNGHWHLVPVRLRSWIPRAFASGDPDYEEIARAAILLVNLKVSTKELDDGATQE